MTLTKRTYWMSFCDPDKPKGSQFLGCCVIDVSIEDADALIPELIAKFPKHRPGAEWIAAASRKAWNCGCNPGGQIATADITSAPAEYLAAYERGRLYSRAEIQAIDNALLAGRTDHS